MNHNKTFSNRLAVSLCLVVLGMNCFAGCQAPAKSSEAIGGNGLDVRAYGARGDGKTLETAAFTRAIETCASRGGGNVIVPAGTYLIGAIELKSSVHLHLEAGATLLASPDPTNYPAVEFPWSAGHFWIAPLIYAHDAHDVAVCGSGTIDGQGKSWWAPILAAKKNKSEPPTTLPNMKAEFPDGTRELPRGRPELLRFLRCKDVVIEGITLHNSPSWNIHPVLAERLRVQGVTIRTDLPAPNTDGINPESCRTVQISNCRIDTGDDCVTLKSGLDEMGRKIGKPDEDITIENCVMYHGHGGVTIGSEMSGGVHNVVVTNCVFHGTDNGIRIKSQRGRGGVVEGIVFSNLVMQDVPHPFVITSFYAGKDKATDEYPVNEATPTLRNILIANVLVRGAADAGSITGLKEMPISNIDFSNVHLEAKKGLTVTNASGIRFHDCIYEIKTGDSVKLDGTTNIETQGLRVVPH